MRNLRRLMLSEREIVEVQGLSRQLARRYGSPESPEFLRRSRFHAFQLPERICQSVHEFRLVEPEETAFVISGYPVDEERIGPTPRHWVDAWQRDPRLATEEEMFLMLLGSLLGECIGWATQQDGRLIQDILPVRGHETEQLETGSERSFPWHTEDAFHSCRGDYVGMLCLRNPDRVATTIGSLDCTRLEDRHLRLLFEPRFPIRPGESHLPGNRGVDEAGDVLLYRAYDHLMQLTSWPQKVSVLSGPRDEPYLRVDPFLMDRLEDDQDSQEALDSLIAALDSNLEDFVPRPGDVWFIDNFRAVHGRKSFKARHDGRDRWLKRITVTRDLRKSRALRRSTVSRVIYCSTSIAESQSYDTPLQEGSSLGRC